MALGRRGAGWLARKGSKVSQVGAKPRPLVLGCNIPS